MKIIKIIFAILISLIFIQKANTEISDSLFMTIGDKAVAQSDIVNEIKKILILNNESYSEEKRDELQKLSVQSILKRKIKEIEIERNNYFEYNKKDLNEELIRLANNIRVDLDTLKNICESNELDFKLIENDIIIELAWNSLIFQLYKNKITINSEEIEEQLKLNQTKKIKEYLISEILISPPEEGVSVNNEIKKLMDKIKVDGFESVAKNFSISKSATNAGDLGWLSENTISKRMRSTIISTPVGGLSKPILLPEGLLIFKIRDKRVKEYDVPLEEAKDRLVNTEKIKILNMHSLSHYDKVKRSIAIKFLQ